MIFIHFLFLYFFLISHELFTFSLFIFNFYFQTSSLLPLSFSFCRWFFYILHSYLHFIFYFSSYLCISLSLLLPLTLFQILRAKRFPFGPLWLPAPPPPPPPSCIFSNQEIFEKCSNLFNESCSPITNNGDGKEKNVSLNLCLEIFTKLMNSIEIFWKRNSVRKEEKLVIDKGWAGSFILGAGGVNGNKIGVNEKKKNGKKSARSFITM